MMKIKSLEGIENNIQHCHKCERSNTRLHAVAGKGDIHPTLFLLGEAPGEQDNKTGSPFSGETGIYLNHMLKLYGLQRETRYTTSILKCWAPGEIKRRHLQACYIWTFKQIMTVNPHWVVVMGRNAEIGMWGKVMNKKLPFIHHWRGYPCVVTCHPKSAVQFKEQDIIFQQGLKLIRGKIVLPEIG